MNLKLLLPLILIPLPSLAACPKTSREEYLACKAREAEQSWDKSQSKKRQSIELKIANLKAKLESK